MRFGGFALLLALAVPLAAQDQTQPQQQAEADQGMLPSWEVAKIAGAIVEHAQSVSQILEQIRPKEWVQDGAPAAYADQKATLESDIANLELSAQALARKPAKLSYVVDTFLWLDRSQSMLRSISSGVRKYQNPAIADLLDSAGGVNAGAIESLKGYMRDLAAEAEAEMEIAHDEAQRCRGELMRAPAQ
ncbi:MAG: hypothetical protein R2748_16260 [Bryobacterales bacterium]